MTEIENWKKNWKLEKRIYSKKVNRHIFENSFWRKCPKPYWNNMFIVELSLTRLEGTKNILLRNNSFLCMYQRKTYWRRKAMALSSIGLSMENVRCSLWLRLFHLLCICAWRKSNKVSYRLHSNLFSSFVNETVLPNSQ